MPRRERAAAEQRLGGPLAEIDREGDAVAVVSGKDYHVFAAWMAAENGAHAFGEENRPGPAVRDANRFERRMQTVHAVFEPAETLLSLSFANIEAVQIRRGGLLRVLFGPAEKRSDGSRHGDQSGAKNDAIGFEQAAP